jgi:lysophospholipase L1-like esterase
MNAQSGKRRLLVNVSISLGSIAAFLIVLNLVLRLGHFGDRHPDAGGSDQADYSQIFRASADPILQRELIPGASGIVNTAGYVGALVPEAKAPGTVRVLGLGDSITMYQSAERRNYLQVAEKVLNDSRDRPRVEFLNFGVGGYDTTQEVHQFEVRGQQYHPDVVTLGYCMNDGVDFGATVNAATGKLTFAQSALDNPPVITFIQQHLDSLTADMTPEQFFAAAFEAESWQRSMTALARLAELSRQQNFRVIVVIFPVLFDFDHYVFLPFHQRLTAQCQTLGFQVLDLLPVFQNVGAAEVLRGDAAVDVIHPYANGHRAAGEALAALLQKTEWFRGP